MDVKTIAAKYGGLPARVIARAEENWRITRAKKSSGMDQFAGPVACIVVAARALDEQVDKTRLAQCAGANKRLIEPTVRKVVDAVGVQTVVKTSPAALCIKFGCEALTEIVHRVLEEYRAYMAHVAALNRRKRLKQLMGPEIGTMNSEDPVFAAACLFAVSKQAKVRRDGWERLSLTCHLFVGEPIADSYCQMHVNQDKLLEAVCGNAKEFDAIVSSIEVQCQLSLSGAAMDRKKRRVVEGKRASKNLLKQYRLEQIEEEERAKRHRTSSNGVVAQTAAQEHMLAKVRASRASLTGQSTGQMDKKVAVATAEEYAVWRASALEFMRNKKRQEKPESSSSQH